MENYIQNILYLHILVGSIALLSGGIALFSRKGKGLHQKAGNIYFWAMTLVFVTGIIVAGYRFNRFLFLIAFLSYYSVFAGIRSLKLKKLHKDQRPEWYDWAAGIINGSANTIFIGLGLYYFLYGNNTMGSLLSVSFGIVGFMISYINMSSFVIRPQKGYHWYLTHIGNMMGGYIATFTAFLSTMVTRFDLMNPYLAFALPTLIGIPFLFYWTKRVEKKFNNSSQSS